MSSATLTCRCRYCGFTHTYLRENVGMDMQCPQCRNTIRLPGKLETVATIKRMRHKDRLGLGLEVFGFLCMFFFFPWGVLVGAIIVFQGWRKSNALRCSNCKAPVPRKNVEKCPKCHSRFGSE